MRYSAQVLADLSFWTPHEGQIGIGKSLFIDGKKEVVAECGRKEGKTEMICYCLWRWAMSNPETFNYYFAPLSNQIDDLIWKNGRLPNFLPPEIKNKYVESISQVDRRIVLKNRSFIKCDGSDNYEKARGYSATGLNAYDETKDFNRHFHDGFDPNRAITDSPLLAVGTPGPGDDLLSKLFDAANSSKTGAAYNLPTWANPHISQAFVERKREEYIARGELDIFLIEYGAQRIRLGTKFVFPMLSAKHVRKHEELLQFVKRNRKDFDFFVSADPGSAKCFAVVFGAIHRFNKHIFILDEIYEPKLGENSVGKMAPKILEKIKAINPVWADWMACYDYAAAWFYSELQSSFKDYPIEFMKCVKDINNKEARVSLIKDALINGVFTISDKCKKTYWEMNNWKTNDKGVLVKENDHAIDCIRYLLNLANYSSVEDAVPLKLSDIQERSTFEKDEETRSTMDGEPTFDDYDNWSNDY